MSASDKLGLSAQTAARTKATTILNDYKSGKKKPTWQELEALIGQTFTAEVKAKTLDYLKLNDILDVWVRKAPERAAAEQQRLKDEIAAAAKRTYQSIDLPLPDGLSFRPQQLKSINALVDVHYNDNETMSLVPLGTGKGKSWIAAGLALWLQRQKPQEFVDAFSLFPKILIITKRSVVLGFQQTLRDLKLQDIGGSVAVWSYQELSSKANKAFFKEDTELVADQPTKVMRFALSAADAPRVIIVDECQVIKKDKIKCAKYLAAFLRFPNIKWIFTSATPAVTLQDTKFMTLAARLKHDGQVVDKENFAYFIRSLAPNGKTNIANAAALERWAAVLGKRYIKPPNDPKKVRAINRVKLFEITDPTNRSMVEHAMDNYLKSVEATGRSVDPRGQVMVAFMVMARAAELATVDTWVEDAIALHKQGYAPVLAIRFTETLKEFVLKLSESEYFQSLGYTRDKISLIWGGAAEIKEEDLLPPDRVKFIGEQWARFVLDTDATTQPTAEDLGISKEEFRDYKKNLKYHSERLFREMSKEAFRARNEKLRAMKLHNQTQEERHENVQRFVNGGTEFCVYTLSSGGTGISLDHRYHHVRPRWVMSTMTYWAEEFAQALGRCDRLPTLTDTIQEIYIPLRTILADHMAPKLSGKLKSIDAIGSSNVDLAAELERAVKRKEAPQELTAEDLKGHAMENMPEAEEDDDDDTDA